MDTVTKFLKLLEFRTQENQETITLLMGKGLVGNSVSVLRQEIDTFIRVVFLATLDDFQYREQLMQCTLQGEKWTEKGKARRITDREMVEIANQLKGYVEAAYKFGCSFIHLSDHHNYKAENPFKKLSLEEQNDIAFYLNYYHGYPITRELSVENISPLVLAIFDKISGNMYCYTNYLEEKTVLLEY